MKAPSECRLMQRHGGFLERLNRQDTKNAKILGSIRERTVTLPYGNVVIFMTR